MAPEQQPLLLPRDWRQRSQRPDPSELSLSCTAWRELHWVTPQEGSLKVCLEGWHVTCTALKITPTCWSSMRTRRVFLAHLMTLSSVLGPQGSESVVNLGSALKLFLIETVETRQTMNQFKIQKCDSWVSPTKYLVAVWHVSYTLSHAWNSPIIPWIWIVSYYNTHKLFRDRNHVFIHSCTHAFMHLFNKLIECLLWVPTVESLLGMRESAQWSGRRGRRHLSLSSAFPFDSEVKPRSL